VDNWILSRDSCSRGIGGARRQKMKLSGPAAGKKSVSDVLYHHTGRQSGVVESGAVQPHILGTFDQRVHV
jgi:hypothetical protein